MIVTVEVTQKHIDEGAQCRAGSCPIALAINALLKYQHGCCAGPTIVTVGYMVDHDIRRLVNSTDLFLPNEARDFIVIYDLCVRNVKPFSFELDIPVHDLLEKLVDTVVTKKENNVL